jgi:hypothetical protein
MIRRTHHGICGVVLALGSVWASAEAQPARPQPPQGQFAQDAASCRAKDYFALLLPNRLETPVFSCAGLTFRLQKDAGEAVSWQVDGENCSGEHAGRAGPKRFRVDASVRAIRIHWPDGRGNSSFLRCDRGGGG